MTARLPEEVDQQEEDALSSASLRFPRIMAGFDVLNGIGSIWIVGLMAIICTDAIARSFFARPISGVSEVTALSIVGIVFLQVAATCLRGRLTNSDLITGLLDMNWPKIGALVKAAFSVVGAVTFLMLAYVSFPALLSALKVPEYTGVTGIYKIPLMPFRLLIVLGSFLAAIAFILRFMHFLLEVKHLASLPKEPADV